MPKRTDIHSVLIIGAGPIIIGQACEFDYSGTQACKVLREEGYEVVLVNSNPATIMTDPEFADRTYLEPLTLESVARIVERERPDALLPTLGGQTALNLAKALHDDGTLERLGVELIGADYDAIHRAEDREAFRATMEGAGLRVPWSTIVDSVAEGGPVIRAVGVETGGSNVQFAVDPKSGEIVVIEMNPRVSRSSALASKATGFPIAKIAAKLAVGYALEEIDNDITGVTPASFEPTIDYVVTKVPRFAFEKFPGAEGSLSTHMKSVGEAMAIGRTFRESFAKAMRSRELDSEAQIPEDTGELLNRLVTPAPDRYDLILEACRRGVPPATVGERTAIDPWFLRELRALATDGDGTASLVRTFKSVDTCAAEFEARTPYYYSAHERPARDPTAPAVGHEDAAGIKVSEPRRPSGGETERQRATGRSLLGEVQRGDRASVVILGSGLNRLGQGIEFNYCCV